MKLTENEIVEYTKQCLTDTFFNDVLGICFFGSNQFGLATEDSDYDIYIIMDSKKYETKKGKISVTNYEKRETVDIEYIIQSYDDIVYDLNDAVENNDYFYYSSLCRGVFIYNKNPNKINNLVNKICNSYVQKNNIQLPEEKIFGERIKIENAFVKLKKYSTYENDDFKYLYPLLLERIRNFYCEANGLPKVQPYKARKIYSNEEYRQKIYGDIKVADDEFMKLYIRCTCSKLTKEEILEKLSTKKLEKEKIPTAAEELLKESRNNKNYMKCLENLWHYVTQNMKSLDVTEDYQYKVVVKKLTKKPFIY